jgi:hypothetical protein
MNKKFYSIIFSIPVSILILAYCSDIKVWKFIKKYDVFNLFEPIWKFIKKYDVFNLFEPIWKIKFNNQMNKQTINFITNTIKLNNSIESNNYYNKHFIMLSDTYIYQSGWKPRYDIIKDLLKNKTCSKKITVNCTEDEFPYYNRVILEFDKNNTDNIDININFGD